MIRDNTFITCIQSIRLFCLYEFMFSRGYITIKILINLTDSLVVDVKSFFQASDIFIHLQFLLIIELNR